jgi:hypothetical protein
MHAFFAAHAAAVALLLEWWLERAGLEIRAGRFIAIAAILALQPNPYEILYWPTTIAYTLGALFLALGIASRRPTARVLGLVCSFLVLETFVLPALGLMLAGVALESWRSKGERSSLIRSLATWGAAVALYATIRAVLSRWSGSYPYQLSLEPSGVLGQMESAVGLLFLIHFHKVYWLESALQLAAITVCAVAAVRGRSIGARPIAWIGFLCFASTASYWVLGYNAPRALYGAGLLFGTAVGWLVYLFMSRAENRWTPRLVSGLLLAAYVAQTLVIFSFKNHNASVLARRERGISAAIASCAEPCTLRVARPDSGLARDWVVPRPYWNTYLRWVQARHAPQRRVTFEIAE